MEIEIVKVSKIKRKRFLTHSANCRKGSYWNYCTCTPEWYGYVQENTSVEKPKGKYNEYCLLIKNDLIFCRPISELLQLKERLTISLCNKTGAIIGTNDAGLKFSTKEFVSVVMKKENNTSQKLF